MAGRHLSNHIAPYISDEPGSHTHSRHARHALRCQPTRPRPQYSPLRRNRAIRTRERAVISGVIRQQRGEKKNLTLIRQEPSKHAISHQLLPGQLSGIAPLQRSRVHSQTLPCMWYRPKLVASSASPLAVFQRSHPLQTALAALMSSPNEKRVDDPARAAYFHSASVASR